MNKSFETLEFDSPWEDLPELAKKGEKEQFFSAAVDQSWCGPGGLTSEAEQVWSEESVMPNQGELCKGEQKEGAKKPD